MGKKFKSWIGREIPREILREKKGIFHDSEYVFCEVSESSYLIDLIISFIWNLLLFSTAIYLSITYTAWWMFLVVATADAVKISRRRRD